MRSKKGLNHVDWAISLSVFLLFIAWFFFFLRPVSLANENFDAYIYVAFDSFREKIFMDVYKTPVVVFSNFDSDDFVLHFPNALRSQEKSFSEQPYYFDENYFFIKANVEEGANFFQIISSDEYYNYSGNPLNFDGKYFYSSKISAELINGFLKKIQTQNPSFTLSQFSFRINGINSENLGENNSHSNKFAVVYERESSFFSAKTYFFDGFSGFFNSFDSLNSAEYEGILSFRVTKPDYFMGRDFNSTIVCVNMNTSRFYVSKNSRHFSFESDKEFRVKFCPAGENLDIDVVFYFDGPVIFRYFFSDLMHPEFSYSFGVPERIFGISFNKTQELSKKSYSELKSEIGFLPGMEFSAKIYNDETVFFTKSGTKNAFSNIFSRERHMVLIDKFGNFELVKFNIGVWR